MAAFITKRVIVEVIPTNIGEGDKTVGYRVDELIASALERGHMLQTVSFEIEEEEWAKMAAMHSPPRAVDTPVKKVVR